MVEAFKEQLRLESQGQVQIPPVLPFFEEMLKDAPQIAKTLPHLSQSQQKIHRSHRQHMVSQHHLKHCSISPQTV